MIKKINAKDEETRLFQVIVNGNTLLETDNEEEATKFYNFANDCFATLEDENLQVEVLLKGIEETESPVKNIEIEEPMVEFEEFPLEDSTDENYGEKAWKLNQIISGMNNEEAYFGSWLYIWPDGETQEQALEDFADKEDYEDLENTFKNIYTAYHDDGLFDVSEDVLNEAHKWDKFLGLPEIEDVKKSS